MRRAGGHAMRGFYDELRGIHVTVAVLASLLGSADDEGGAAEAAG